jgi:hypothetical protein
MQKHFPLFEISHSSFDQVWSNLLGPCSQAYQRYHPLLPCLVKSPPAQWELAVLSLPGSCQLPLWLGVIKEERMPILQSLSLYDLLLQGLLLQG